MNWRAAPEPPPGFVVSRDGHLALYVAAELAAEACARGLDRREAWERALASGGSTSGRGVSAVIGPAAGPRWRLKRMRRGGWMAKLWRDRYPSAARLVATLAAPVTAAARGVPTARPVALLVASTFGGMVEGAMAVEEIDGALDLARLVTARAVTPGDLESALGAVRAMHDRGVLHPDLNLGNILLRPRPAGAPEAFIIDFDRASFRSGPLPFSARQAGVRRLERSCAKLTGAPGPLGPGSEDLWYTIYAGDDPGMAQRFARGRRLGRLAIAVHRLGWKRSTT